MCYGDPWKLLADMLEACPDVPRSNGHTIEDDFEHFCAYSGLDASKTGRLGFAWVRYEFFSARLNCPPPSTPETAETAEAQR